MVCIQKQIILLGYLLQTYFISGYDKDRLLYHMIFCGMWLLIHDIRIGIMLVITSQRKSNIVIHVNFNLLGGLAKLCLLVKAKWPI